MTSGSSDNHFSVPFVHRLRFTSDVFGADQQVLDDLLEATGEQQVRVQFWLDENVSAAQPELRTRMRDFADRRDHIDRVSNVQIVPGGEEIKNDIHILERMLKVMNAANLDRRSYVVVAGGGAVLDTVGFAAQIAHRGIRLIRLPTTTLGQGDSGVGVKSAVNLFHKKNWLGAFGVPWAVINDAQLLRTLGQRDFRCGFSESVKVALLKSRALFEQVCGGAIAINERDFEVATPVIRASAQMHIDHITRGGDPFEMNEARPLDYGHWSAHKLESMTEFRLRHGEAVAMGVAIDTIYSSLAFGLDEADVDAVLQCLCDLGFELSDPALSDVDTLFEGLEEFRQHLGGRLTLTMVPKIEHPIEVHEVDRDLMLRAIERVAMHAGSTK